MTARPSNFKLTLVFALMVTIWSLAFVVAKVVTREIPPLLAGLLRAAGTAAAFTPLAVWEARRKPGLHFDLADLPRLIAAGLTGITLNQLGFVVGVSLTSVSHSSIVFTLQSVLVLLAAVVAHLERASARQFAGMALALAGVIGLQFGRFDSGSASLAGDLIVLGGAAAFAVYAVLNKQLVERYGSMFLNAASFAIGAVGMLPLGLWAARTTDVSRYSPAAWWGLAFMILLQGVVAYSCFYYLLHYVSASRVSLYAYLQPVLATFFAWMLLAEAVPVSVLIAGAVVFLGVWLSMRPPRSDGEAR